MKRDGTNYYTPGINLTELLTSVPETLGPYPHNTDVALKRNCVAMIETHRLSLGCLVLKINQAISYREVETQ